MKLLVADDCETIRRFVSVTLNAAGFDVTTVNDGHEALRQIKTGMFPLAILDWMMPGMSGLEICKSLQDEPRLGSIYTIILTSKDRLSDCTTALQSGACDYIAKPVQQEELVARAKVGERILTMNRQLAEAQKLESIGQLAAGLSHEINTPIQFVGDNTEFLSESFELIRQVLHEIDGLVSKNGWDETNADPQIAKLVSLLEQTRSRRLEEEIPTALQESLEGISHVSKIVTSMSRIAHPGSDNKTQCQLNEIVSTAMTITRNEWKYVAEIDTHLDAALPTVLVNEPLISQVLVNLIVNSAYAIGSREDASKKRGKITVTTKRQGEMVELCVQDDGIGIPKDVIRRVFDPFYTTKDIGRGTGQGLAIAWNTIVNLHHGSLEVDSAEGVGTTLRIRLPKGEQDQPEEACTPDVFTSDKLRVLFVDDEEKILNGLRRMLLGQHKTWEMKFVHSGSEAIVLLAEQGTDVVVTDMCMPEMNGLQLLEHVKAQNPEIVRIILSGKTDLDMSLRSVGPAHQFLVKPCNTTILKNAINQACNVQSILSQSSLKRIVSGLSTLPSVPSLFQEIERVLKSDRGSLADVSQIVRQDPAMTVQILKVVNSGFMGLSRRLDDVHEAIVHLGINTTRSLVLSYGVFSQFDDLYLKDYSVSKLAKHSLTVAHLAKKMAILDDKDDAFVESCYLAGFVHNVGQLILASSCQQQFSHVIELAADGNISLFSAEEEVFGTNHGAVGAFLLALWGVSLPVVEAVSYHQQPSDSTNGLPSPLSFLHAALCLIDENVDPCSFGRVELDMRYLKRCGLDERLGTWRDARDGLRTTETCA